PNADVPAGTVLSAPPQNLVTVTVTRVMHKGKKFRHVVVTSTTGNFILGRLVLSGLSLNQYGKPLSLNQKQPKNVPTFEGSLAVDVVLTPGGKQMFDVPAGAGFTPTVVAGL